MTQHSTLISTQSVRFVSASDDGCFAVALRIAPRDDGLVSRGISYHVEPHPGMDEYELDWVDYCEVLPRHKCYVVASDLNDIPIFNAWVESGKVDWDALDKQLAKFISLYTEGGD